MGSLIPRTLVSVVLALMLTGPLCVLVPSVFRLAPAVCPAGSELVPERRPTGRGYSVVVGCRGTSGEMTYGYTGRAFLHLAALAAALAFAGMTLAGVPDLSRLGAGREKRAPSGPPARRIPWGEEKKARALAAQGQLIQAIKLIRDAGELGLAEAKAYAEWLRDTPELSARVSLPADDPETNPHVPAGVYDGDPNASAASLRVRDVPEAAAVVAAHLRALRDRADPAARLAKLQALRDAGLISAEEHEAKRREVLDAI